MHSRGVYSGDLDKALSQIWPKRVHYQVRGAKTDHMLGDAKATVVTG
jgi:hypothetical protein